MRYQPRTKPFKHQSKATLRAVRQRNHAVFFEPRLGKSKVALDWAAILAWKQEVKRVLIIAPRIAIDVWEDEIHKHFPLPAFGENYDETWMFNTAPPKGGSHDAHRPHVHFFLAGREETFRATRGRGGKLVRPKQKVLEHWQPDGIIIDESHEYKRPGGRGSQDAWRLVRRLRKRQVQKHRLSSTGGATSGRGPRPYVLLLSGTPNPKGLRDLFAQYRIMDESVLGTNAGVFDEEFCIYGQGVRKYTIIRYRNTRRLQRLIDERCTAVSADEAGLAGVLTFQRLYCTLPHRAREIYDKMASEFVSQLDGGEVLTASNIGVRRLRLQQITGGFTTDGVQIHAAKLGPTVDYLRVLHSQGERVVVGARFLPEVSACRVLAERAGFDTAVIAGVTKKPDRRAFIRAFQASTGPAALIFQVQAGSAAIELSNAAEVLFYSLPEGWVQFWQFLNRVRGPNQKRPVRVSAVLARGTLDPSVLYNLSRKEDAHATLMKNPKRYLRGDVGW